MSLTAAMRPAAGRAGAEVVMREWDAAGKLRGSLVFLFPVSLNFSYFSSSFFFLLILILILIITFLRLPFRNQVEERKKLS
jgi:hypothetical protein